MSVVQAAGEVLQAAVHLDGDDPVAGAQPAGHGAGGDEVGARRRAGEDALGARGRPRHRERVGLAGRR